MSEVILDKVEKVYPNGFKAIHGIDLAIRDGEFMVFVGPSGCGKSTALRMIAGLEDITSGDVFIGNQCVNDLQPSDRGIAMVFQTYALYPHMTAFENISFGLVLEKVPETEINVRVQEVAKKLHITDILHKYPREMSGGQQQRIAVGRAIVRKPEVFLFDEPLSNLDAKLRVALRIEIKELHNQLKRDGESATMIYVTHDQVEAMTMGDRICVMNKGLIMQVDTPYNLYHKPRNKFVASFMGSPAMNIIEATVLKTSVGYSLAVEDDLIPLSQNYNSTLETYKDKKVWFGIRPEGVIPVTNEDEDFLFEKKVSLVEQLGSEEIIYLEIGGKEFRALRDSKNAEFISNGEKIKVNLNLDEIHIFDFDTEENITL